MTNQIDAKIESLLNGFFHLTASETERMRALRALTLHMLIGHAPLLAERDDLRLITERSVNALTGFPVTFEPDLDVDIAMARLDVCYLLHERRLPFQAPVAAELQHYLNDLVEKGYLIYAWLLAELAGAAEINVKIQAGMRPYKDISRLLDLYWVTHQFLLATHYLHKQLPMLGWQSRLDELGQSVDWLIEHQQVDLAAEVAICLQLGQRQSSRAHWQLIEFIGEHLQPDGSVIDPSVDRTEDNVAHATAAVLLAYAGCR